MGSSVLVGIATTKFIGVIVLAFAPSTLFKLYYFRMYLLIIVFGAFNGMMFLPTILSIYGPMEDKQEIIEQLKDERFFTQLKKILGSDYVHDSQLNPSAGPSKNNSALLGPDEK